MDHRLTSLLACALLLLISAPTTASAQGAWCARMLGGGENCGFATFGQCQAALSGNGGACAPNPRSTARTNGPSQSDDYFGRGRIDQSRAARRQIEQERQYEQERRFERDRRIEQERRRAVKTQKSVPAATVRGTPALAPATPVSTVATGGIPLMELDINATPTLSPDGVRRVQVALKGKGFDPGPINGIRHPQLQVAVQTFQTTYGIDARGVIDNQTLLALGEAELARQSTGSQPK